MACGKQIIYKMLYLHSYVVCDKLSVYKLFIYSTFDQTISFLASHNREKTNTV